ncbi:MAG TPA: transposase [Candidatus Hydrogenedentes bacterium]|nr:transposase [Candidatus Hydrogenedentota bacterium]
MPSRTRHQDREAYLGLLQGCCSKRGLSVWAYCLMSNHVHLVVVPETEASLSEALRDTHTVYAMYFNARTEMSGHGWQGRFFSSPLDESYLWAAVRYVELNPVRARMVDRAEAYRWSSAAAHCGLRHDGVLSPDFPPPGVIDDWTHWLHEPLANEERIHTSIHRNTHTGRPCGSPTFIEKLEQLLGRRLTRRPPGPKPGTKYRKSAKDK